MNRRRAPSAIIAQGVHSISAARAFKSASRSPQVGKTASALSAPLLGLASMLILITGGCGFIGSNFIRYILQHYKPASVSNVDVLTYAGNLANLDGVVEQYGDRYEFFKADIANADQMDEVMTEQRFYAVVNFLAEFNVHRSV